MKTTEVFVEQVLIGLLVLATAAALAMPPLLDGILGADVGKLAVVVAAAYLAGVVYDRFADTLLEDLERHRRIAFALGVLDPRSKGDPFPEDRYRITLLASREGSDHAHYLRTRIRLTRSLGTLAPAMAAGGAALALPEARTGLAILVASAYVLGLVAKFATDQRIAELRPRCVRWPRWYKWPRTTDLASTDVRRTYKAVVGYSASRRGPRHGWLWFAVLWESSVQILIALTLAVGALLAYHSPLLAVYPAAGLVVALLTCWTWWRISGTFMAFLRNFHRYRPDPR